ncbi:hypothetical protein J7E50_23475 [Pedobacter sp. ISL-68]|uniref:hypothetical protein n=1 Tax=unclassified Pedobacter TaxID=2628915 RepID=UPI001BEA18AA|nr:MULTISPECIES: hypothetical protein [unclassified Pedobacter]MBT2564381.1 hypothetical protein [Pedobacter sp. ISL-64]MBT2593201.1 hypothetical protein [Pedobacter sp. ISL-68]
MTAYNLKVESGKLSFQPKRDYKGKVLFFAGVAAAIFIVVPLLNLHHDTKWAVMAIGMVATITAVYDFIFHFNVTYIFDEYTRLVYRKIPGLYMRKIMGLDDIHIIHIQEDGLLHYALSHKQNKYGKSFAISQPFGTNRKSEIRQEAFENEVLTEIEKFTRGNGRS